MPRLHLPSSAPYTFSFVRIADAASGRIERALLSATLPEDLRLADGRDVRLLHRLGPHLARRRRVGDPPDEPECVLLCERLGHAYLVSAEEARGWGFPVPCRLTSTGAMPHAHPDPDPDPHPEFTREQREHVEGWLALLPPEYAQAFRGRGTVHRWACAPEPLVTYPRRSPVPTAVRGGRPIYEDWSWAVLWNRLRVHDGTLLHQVALYDASKMVSEIVAPAYEAHDLRRFDRHLQALLDQMDACARDYLRYVVHTGDDPLDAVAVPRARWGDRTIELRFAVVGGVVCVVEPDAAEIPDELRAYLLLDRRGGLLVADAESLEELPTRYPRLSFDRDVGAVLGRCRLVEQVPAQQRRTAIRRRAEAVLREW